MGYDMRYVRTPDGEAEAVAAARTVLQAAVAERDQIPREEMGRLNFERAKAMGDYDSHDSYDGRTERYHHAQDKVNAALAEMDKAQTSYFRLSIFGMCRYRVLMFDLGMVFEDEPYPEFPDVEDYGTTHEDFWALGDPGSSEFAALTPERLEKANAFAAARRDVLGWHGKADTPGIPIHKFGSNDGWIVWPAECEAAVRIWEKFVTDRGEENARAYVEARVEGYDYDYWLRWIEYLRGAARHGGFEVH